MKYHVTYFYLATGMEGQADTKDYGIIEADSKEEAKEYVVNHVEPWRKRYSLKTEIHNRHWGLCAEKVKEETMKKQVIEINKTYHYLEGAMSAIVAEFGSNQVLVDHPDQTVTQSAMMLIDKLIGTGILDPKIEAIYKYHKALVAINEYTVTEE